MHHFSPRRNVRVFCTLSIFPRNMAGTGTYLSCQQPTGRRWLIELGQQRLQETHWSCNMSGWTAQEIVRRISVPTTASNKLVVARGYQRQQRAGNWDGDGGGGGGGEDADGIHSVGDLLHAPQLVAEDRGNEARGQHMPLSAVAGAAAGDCGRRWQRPAGRHANEALSIRSASGNGIDAWHDAGSVPW